jgi:hypothetical protein
MVDDEPLKTSTRYLFCWRMPARGSSVTARNRSVATTAFIITERPSRAYDVGEAATFLIWPNHERVTEFSVSWRQAPAALRFQSGVGGCAASIMSTSVGILRRCKRNPSCSWTAVKIDGRVTPSLGVDAGSLATSRPGGDHIPGSGTHFNAKS